MLVHKPSLSLPCCYCILWNAFTQTNIHREYDNLTSLPRDAFIYVYDFFPHLLEYKKKRTHFITVGCYVNMCTEKETQKKEKKKQINSISHMEFMIFYVNCGTRLEYYMRSLTSIQSSTSRVYAEKRKNNTHMKMRRWRQYEKNHTRKNYYHFFRLFSFAHALHIKTYPKITSETFYVFMNSVVAVRWYYQFSPLFCFFLPLSLWVSFSFYFYAFKETNEQTHIHTHKRIHWSNFTLHILHVKFLINKCTNMRTMCVYFFGEFRMRYNRNKLDKSIYAYVMSCISKRQCRTTIQMQFTCE